MPLGAHAITLTVEEGNGGKDTDTVEVTVNDTVPPELSISVTPDELWPPTHKMTQITTIVSAKDACDLDPSVALLNVSSNESDESNTYNPETDVSVGDGNTENDIVIDASGNVSLRAERAGSGDGRVYTITYFAEDTAGNETTKSATVTVPRDK